MKTKKIKINIKNFDTISSSFITIESLIYLTTQGNFILQ